MNINDYKDVNGNVLVSEQLISDLIASNHVPVGAWVNGTVIGGTTGTVKARKNQDGLVTIHVQLTPHTTTINQQIALLPEGYSPVGGSNYYPITVINLSTAQCGAWINLTPAGYVTVSGSTNFTIGQMLVGTISYYQTA